MTNASKYRLKVTAGPDYPPSSHTVVRVNSPATLKIENAHGTIHLCVRIRNYTGYPDGAPESSPYFEHANHVSDQYSIAVNFVPKKDVRGSDLVFGNDFDRPIRDRLPPGFNQALKFVRWWIDPGLEGDAYADKPFLYGPALSSWNVFRIGEKGVQANAGEFHDEVLLEGAEGSGEEVRSEANIPELPDARKKFFLDAKNREAFTFEAGRTYLADFGNPYLDFNDFSLKLPRFHLNVIKYIDEKTHELRYVLKNKETDDVYFVVLFTLTFLESEDGESDANSVKGVEKGGQGTIPANEAKEADATDVKKADISQDYQDEDID